MIDGRYGMASSYLKCIKCTDSMANLYYVLEVLRGSDFVT